MKETLFDLPDASIKKMDVLPVSVLEIEKQHGGRREDGCHDEESSRSEFSHFPREVANLCMEFYLRDSSNIFDPFAGWGERHSAAKQYNKNYIGFDINSFAIQQAEEIYGVKNINADSKTDEIPTHDGFITCPPYWNLESYCSGGIDSCGTWKDFLSDYESILTRSFLKADAGSTYCIMVGDWRKDHNYYDLTYQTRKIFDKLGAKIWDEVIVSRRTISKIKIMLPQAKRLGYSVKVHETLLVFKK